MITKEQYWDYEEVRLSGVTNMFAIGTVCDLTGLDRMEVIEIMENYGELTKKYNKQKHEPTHNIYTG